MLFQSAIQGLKKSHRLRVCQESDKDRHEHKSNIFNRIKFPK